MNILVLATALLLQDPSWHKTLQKGLQASAKSRKPVLLLTTWSQGT